MKILIERIGFKSFELSKYLMQFIRNLCLVVSIVVDRVARYSDWLRAGRSGDRIPVGCQIFRTCPDRPWGPPSLLYDGYRVFTGGKVRLGRAADHSPPSNAAVMEE
jgi:hypothetical protein